MKVKNAVSWAFAESVISAGASLLSILVAARFLAPSDFGEAAVALALVTVVRTFACLGLPVALVKAEDATPPIADQLFFIMLMSGAATCLLVLAAAQPLASFYDNPVLFALIAVSSIELLLQPLVDFRIALLTRRIRTRTLAVRMLWLKLASFITVVSVALAGGGAWALVLGSLSGQVFSVLSLWYGAPRIPKPRKFTRDVKPLLRLGVLNVVEQIFVIGTTRIFLLLFGAFHGFTALGLLNFAIRLVDETGNLLRKTIQRISLAMFSDVRRRKKDPREMFLQGSFLIMLIAVPVFIGLAIVAGDLVPLIFGDTWAAAVPAVQIMCGYWCVQMTRALVPGLLRSIDKQGLLAFNSAVAFVITMLGAYLTKDAVFAVAVAALTFRVAATLPIGLSVISRSVGIPIWKQVRCVAAPTIAGLCMIAATLLVRSWLPDDINAIAQFALVVVTGAATYAGLVLVTSRGRMKRALALLPKRGSKEPA